MSFVIDGGEWNFNGFSVEDIESAIDKVLEHLERIIVRGETFFIGEDFHSKPMLGNKSLWDLFDQSSNMTLCPEIAQELAGKLARARHYEDDEWPKYFEDLDQIAIGNNPPSDNPDVLWVHLHSLAGNTLACLGVHREGQHIVTSCHASMALHWVRENNTQIAFWRDFIERERDSPDSLRRLAPHAFPQLYFPESVWRGCNQFEGGYFSQSAELRRYLAVLNDHGAWVFTAPPPTEHPDQPQKPTGGTPSSQLIIRRFVSLALDITPEKPNVKQDRNCREAREVVVGGRKLYCEWHGKLQAWQNRIYIHPPVAESGGKVVIAIMTDHLPLP